MVECAGMLGGVIRTLGIEMAPSGLAVDRPVFLTDYRRTFFLRTWTQ